eukprot:evm.model.scf_983.2 EVM.evm.TU.scf_983.2   scf_983:13173-28199(-)
MDLLHTLGVSAHSAEKLEERLLQEAQHRLAEEDEHRPEGDKGKDDESALQQHLCAVELEIEGVEAALLAEEPDDEEGLDHKESSTSGSASEGTRRRDLQKATLAERLAGLKRKQQELKGLQHRGAESAHAMLGDGSGASFVETDKDKLVRLGLATPFANIAGFEKCRTDGGNHMDESGCSEQPCSTSGTDWEDGDSSEDWPSIEEVKEKYSASYQQWQQSRPRTKFVDHGELPTAERHVRRVDPIFWHQVPSGSVGSGAQERSRRKRTKRVKRLRPARPKKLKKKAKPTDHRGAIEQSDWIPSDGTTSPRESDVSSGGNSADESLQAAGGNYDDRDDEAFQQRIAGLGPEYSYEVAETAEDGSRRENSSRDFVAYDGGFRIPSVIHSALFDYQKTAVKWLWELHTQRAGGIVGDEMGLGKTIQMAAFLAGLHASGMFRPTLVVCPATVLKQWLRELRVWWPRFRVVILHNSAARVSDPKQPRENLIRKIGSSTDGILLTTYAHLRIYQKEFLQTRWGYVVLDEGHKIRNPDAEITLVAKQVKTVHRIIMTGAPIQNRLTELWSLFDFVFPGKLGTLPVFQTQFALPIQIGGYKNASSLQVSTAYKCAVVLRDLIAPYLLHRRKADVNVRLPKKSEQVLFCDLTKEQRDLYCAFIYSKDVEEIVEGNRRALAGIDVLRKICNHPDLLERGKYQTAEDYGNPDRSGKLLVTASVLKHWKSENHKVLLFSQTQQMLDIIEKFVVKEGYNYHRMDGYTPVASRSRLIDDFNNNPDLFLFLLTTKVGGLGVNLTSANRVLLYDPDWNPATDIQARERAWRIGQKRDVTIYRLITTGTIEEKIYHRQVYKHFLKNKILQDPRQKRFFTARDMRDLFTLGDGSAPGTETGTIFRSLGSEINPRRDDPQPCSGPNAPSTSCSAGPGAENAEKGAPRRNSGNQPWKLSRTGGRHQGSATAEDGRRIDASDGEDCPSGADPRDQGDTKILAELFEGQGVRGAMDHGKIEAANNTEAVAVDLEASRVAREAAERLRESRRACQSDGIAVPTWTGRSGRAGAPSGLQGRQFGGVVNPRLNVGPSADRSQRTPLNSQRRFGSGQVAGTSGGAAPRSADLLAQMRARHESEATASTSAAARDCGSSSQLADRWTAEIVDFLGRTGGRRASSEVVEQFRDQVTPENLSIFRGVLKQVAQLTREAQERMWVLKPEFS